MNKSITLSMVLMVFSIVMAILSVYFVVARDLYTWSPPPSYNMQLLDAPVKEGIVATALMSISFMWGGILLFLKAEDQNS
ncbi:MAG: hypothetical protein AAFQ83_25150 [Bacteroidota bacterium]